MQKPKLLVQLQVALRPVNYALSTEKCYISWVRQFILHHNKRHPKSNVALGKVMAFAGIIFMSANVGRNDINSKNKLAN